MDILHKALESVPVKKVTNWCKRNIGESVQSKRKKFLKGSYEKEVNLKAITRRNKNGEIIIGYIESFYQPRRGPGDKGLYVIGTDGINRTHKRIRTIKTILGDIEIKRLSYFARSASNMFPLDAKY